MLLQNFKQFSPSCQPFRRSSESANFPFMSVSNPTEFSHIWSLAIDFPPKLLYNIINILNKWFRAAAAAKNSGDSAVNYHKTKNPLVLNKIIRGRNPVINRYLQDRPGYRRTSKLLVPKSATPYLSKEGCLPTRGARRGGVLANEGCLPTSQCVKPRVMVNNTRVGIRIA